MKIDFDFYSFHIGVVIQKKHGFCNDDLSLLEQYEKKICDSLEANGAIFIASIFNKKIKELDFYANDYEKIRKLHESGQLNINQHYQLQLLIENDKSGTFYEQLLGL